jgi:signal transduction histidine kinase/CheY-like chemotaxis protein
VNSDYDHSPAQREENRYKDIMDSISAGIAVLRMPDADHISFEYVNRQMFRLLHFTDETDVGSGSARRIHSYDQDGFSDIHPDDLERVLKTFHDNFYSEKFTVDNYRALGGDGKYYWLRQDVRLREITPHYRRFYAAYFDVTEEMALREDRDRQLEKEKNLRMQAMAANRAKSDFLSSMSHDIRTPLNAIIGMTNMAIDRIDDKKQALEDLQIVQSSARSLLMLINDVLDLSKIESGKMKITSENFIFPELLVELQSVGFSVFHAKQQNFHINADTVDHEFLIGDAMHLKQVLMNLLSNANKYTPYGGKIDLVIEELPADKPAKTVFRFSVIDNGIGIESSRIQEVFEPFTREVNTMVNPVEGTGLGLTIVKNIVTAMGGNIEVSSEKGKGSVFTVTVPFGVQDEAKAMERFSDVKDTRVLLIAPDAEQCEKVRRAYHDAGIPCDAITEEQIEASAGAMQNDYDAVVVFNFYDSLNSIRRIRASAGKQNILFVCDINEEEVLDSAVSAGADALLYRPVFKTTFFEELQKIRRRKSGSGDDRNYLQGRRILVAEDQPINYLIVENLLLTAGAASVKQAENGKTAVELFSSSEAGYYDLILMDVMMPVMGGYEATRMIRGLNRKDAATVPIVAMTANAFFEDIQKSHAAGMNAHISKPIDPETVRKVLGRVLEDTAEK